MPYGGTILASVNADLVQADVDGIVQGVIGSGGKTLSDVQERLSYLGDCLSGVTESVLVDLLDGLNLGLFDEDLSPTLQSLREELNDALIDPSWCQPWLGTLNETIWRELNRLFYHSGGDQPWFETIHYALQLIRNELSALRAVLEDVHDSAQHALRTV